MTQGIVYYNKGCKCIVRLCCSIASMRQNYDGPACVIFDGKPPGWLISYILMCRCEYKFIPDTNEKALVRKSQLWRYTPYDWTMYIDADTIILSNPEPFFSLIREYGFVVHWFSGWQTTGRKVSGRIKQWRSVFPRAEIRAAINYGKAVNTGVFGFDRTSSETQRFLNEWETNTRIGYQKNATRRMVDELACQVLLPRHRHFIAGQEWGASVKFYDQHCPPYIRHYHGAKHVLDLLSCNPWKKEFWHLVNTSKFSSNILSAAKHDRRLKRYIRSSIRSDITIVTAVNPEYIPKFRRNFSLWMNVSGIREQQFIVFVNRMRSTDARLAFLGPYIQAGRLQIVPWKHPQSGDNVRERMLSSFVFGVAKHVKTKYWMKLDADVVPKTTIWEWPDYRRYTIAGHRWGYTRVKGDDPLANRHWLNRLDDFFGCNLFPEIPVKTRYRHRRIATFCAIEKTDHTRNLAEICNKRNGGRLPVPSQDTTSWCFAVSQSEPILRVNMKRYFSA